MRNWFLCWLASGLLSVSAPTLAIWSGEINSDIWQLPATTHSTRWLVIHHRAASTSDGIYHIEVLERAKGAPVWQLKHLASHMAITTSALRASIVKPLKRGAVYPETFDFAYAAWKLQHAQGKTIICESNVVACLK